MKKKREAHNLVEGINQQNWWAANRERVGGQLPRNPMTVTAMGDGPRLGWPRALTARA